MSGRGKGAKGLGKGGAKRHRKVLNWRLIKAYMDLVAPFEIATKKLGGDTYPASMMVVPMLDQLHSDLQRLPETRRREEVARQRRSGEQEGATTWGEDGEGKRLADRMVERFNIRFPRQFKLRAPFNALLSP